MVLAAGRGERLRPLTDRYPKPMIPVAGKPLIHYTLCYLKNCGINEVAINLHHLGGQIQEYVGDGEKWGLRIYYSSEKTLLGTGGGIQKVAHFFIQEPFVVMNADIVIEVNLKKVLAFHHENNAQVTMVLRKDPEVDRYGAIELDGYNQIKQLLGKLPVPAGGRRRLMFTGLHILEPAVFDYMPLHTDIFSIVDVYLAMLRSGERLMGFEMKGFWTDLGTPARYEQFQRLLNDRKISMEQFVEPQFS